MLYLFTLGLYGVLFPDNEEPSFTNYRMWESLGFCMAYLMNNLLNVKIHTFISMSGLFIGMTGYAFVEILSRRKPVKEPEKTVQYMKNEDFSSSYI